MIKNRAKYLLLSWLYAIIGVSNVFAAGGTGVIENPIQADSFAQVVKKIAELLIKIGIPLASIFIVWSGFLFVSARGNETGLTKAKETFKWTILGTALIVGAYAIAEAVINFAKQL